MLFWHLGGTVALVRYTFRDDRMDLRFLAAGAVLPDVLDTPVGLAWFGSLGSARLVAHSLAFASLAMVVVLLTTRRGRPRKRWMPLAVGVLVHLFLDAMWADPETLWWPFLGATFTPAGFDGAGAYLADILGDWRVWTLEGVGLLYLAGIARKGGLSALEARHSFVRTGRLDAPIER